MKQPITGFHQDDERHWVAELSCGHVQHVRHDPPLVTREWTQSSHGRQSMIGYQLDCLKCDDGEPADETKLRTMLQPKRTNTILYCEKWSETVAFYRDALGFKVATERDWFVEFQLTDDSYLSVAHAEKTSISPVEGQGITLTWEVVDVNSLADKLKEIGIETTDVKQNWGALSCIFHDPEGHRIEIWQTTTN